MLHEVSSSITEGHLDKHPLQKSSVLPFFLAASYLLRFSSLQPIVQSGKGIVDRHSPLKKSLIAAAGSDADLSAFEGHDLHIINSNATLTFEHTYTWWGNKRVLRVLAEPNVTLDWSHVPVHCRRARTVLLGPLMPEDIDCQSFVHKSRGRTFVFLH